MDSPPVSVGVAPCKKVRKSMRPHADNGRCRKRIFFLSLCLLLSGCHSKPTNGAPVIIFSKVPQAETGGPDKVDTIEGRVTGARADQQLVLYAKSEELWWVQPYTNRPFTRVHRDSTWKNETHLGTDYAALLVDEEYTPPDTTETLPVPGAGVAAVAVIKGNGLEPPTIAPKPINFSGYDWKARTAGSYRGGSHNSFDPANAWADKSGALHLRITRRQNDWICAEVKLTRSLGYGTYRFTVGDVSHLEPSAILTLVDWDGVGTEQNRRELDIEIGRWGFANNENAQYVVQPYYIPVNISKFQVPNGVLTYSFHWEPSQVTFTTAAGSSGRAAARVISQHVFTSGIPSPGADSVRISLYAFGKGQVPLKNETEVVIEKFEYLP